MDLGLEGRVALVMGASRGLGKAIAAALAREGAKVALASRSQEAIDAAAAEIGGGATGFVADATDLPRLADLPGEVEAKLGPVDVLVANTGGPPLGGTLDQELDEWERAYRALVLAPRVLSAAVVPGMRERGWGRIVNVGSTSTREPIPGLNLSNSHRMAAVGFLKTLARDVAADGITVNTVATGTFATDRLADPSGSLEPAEAAARERVPGQRLGRPEEYGDLVAFLCSERAAYITGAVIPIDGGALHSAF
ncbi:MAG TPA: SDR family oxidoreductase [Solirubrobacterales bacterium]|nr:SDR family oxidoreductase [Solirubrobacterales bacterium]